MMKIDKSWYIKPKGIKEVHSCGGIVVRKDGDRLLVALIHDKKFTNYMLPKGRIEKGESKIEAAKREVSEEAGLNKLNLIRELGVKERLTFKKHEWRITHYFLFETVEIEGKQKLEKGEEDYVVEWFDLNNLPEFFWPEQKQLIEENKEKIINLLSK